MRKYLLAAGALLMLAGAVQAQPFEPRFGPPPPPPDDHFSGRGYDLPPSRDHEDGFRESDFRRPPLPPLDIDEDFAPPPRRCFWIDGDIGPRRVCRGGW